jgi:tRNA(Ile)-lysidine synthase
VLLQRVNAYISRHSLISHGQTLAVGVSGGPDSIVLLHLLTQLRDQYALNLTVVHLDHGLRPDSDLDAEFVARTASAWGIASVVERADVGALAQARGLSVEEAGRVARYELFAKVAPAVAVAHHADDQAETVLMHFLRGSGIAGLRGMLPVTQQFGLTVIRPLLDVTRAEIETYIAEHQLSFVIDPTNTDTTYFRNRLRHELLPILEAYNPNIRERLRHTAEVMQGDYELLRRLVTEAWDYVGLKNDAQRCDFDLAKWRALPVALQRALLRESVGQLKAELRDADFDPIDHAARWSQTAQSGHRADLLGGLYVEIVGTELRVGNWIDVNTEDEHTTDAVLLNEGATQFDEAVFIVIPLDSFSMDEIEANTDKNTAYLDASLAPFYLRTRREGDRFQPLGMDGTMKLSDYMINRKMLLDRRDTWPLVCCGENAETVLWVCRIGMSEAGRVKAETGRVVKISYHKDLRGL